MQQVAPTAQPSSDPRTPRNSLALSRVLENATSPQLASYLTATFDSGYSCGDVDGLAFKFHLLSEARTTACIETLNELMIDAKGDAVFALGAETLKCSSWKNPRFEDASIPGRKYSEERLAVAQEATGSSAGPVVLNAFEAGYAAGVEDARASRAEIGAVEKQVCLLTARAHVTSRPPEAICAKVELESLQQADGARSH